jgi:hypothetical protein
LWYFSTSLPSIPGFPVSPMIRLISFSVARAPELNEDSCANFS